MRKFSLVNKYGDSYDLTLKDNFFYNPKGLGFERGDEAIKISGKTVILSRKYRTATVKGSLFFNQPGAYQKYYDFVRFASNDPLKIVYMPFDTFNADCIISKIEKGELSTGATGLSVEVELELLGLWYKEKYIFNSGAVQGGKTYDYTYDYTYSDDIAMTVSVQSDSFVDSPCKLEIYGPITNPTWVQLVNSVQVSSGAYTGTIPSNHKLVIDTTDIPYSIKEYDLANTLIADRYSLCDFSTNRFLFIENGLNRITIGADSVNTVPVGLGVQLSYASV